MLQATKWSTFAEITAKLFSPIATMFLARLLAPEAFGTIATITVIISFTEVFTETGFQKYLIQRDFKSQNELLEHSDVAFVSNLIFALILSSLIIMHRDSIAGLMGNETLGLAIAVSCISIPLSAFSSLQTALLKRHFDFRTLFGSRLLSLVIPLVITVPVAFFLKNYWALVAGTLTVKCVNAIYLTLKTNWRPRLYFRVNILREMFAFTSWTILESCFIWLSSYAGILLVGIRLDEFYLGLYATSITLVTQVLGVGISAVTPILFSTLSRLQNNAEEFNKVYLLFQSSVALVVIPIGALLYS
ncbi:MAG: oligosaccharide flippase family protein, partial [Bacteroidia bacterium]|nr:oligosaccharide flippase family protein [Bacteroidia bacterium]